MEKKALIITPSDNPITWDNKVPVPLYNRVQSNHSWLEKEWKKSQNHPQDFFPPLTYGFSFQPALTAAHSAHLRQPPPQPIPSPSTDLWHP